jgi:hypothetical protein
LHDAKHPARASAFISGTESRPFYGIEQGPSSINLKKDSTKERLEDLDVTQDSILHFATHAVIGDRVKWVTQAALVLSPEGTGREDDGIPKRSKIFNLRLDAGLWVLSAGETALERIARLPIPPVLVTQRLAGRRGNTPLDL